MKEVVEFEIRPRADLIYELRLRDCCPQVLNAVFSALVDEGFTREESINLLVNLCHIALYPKKLVVYQDA